MINSPAPVLLTIYQSPPLYLAVHLSSCPPVSPPTVVPVSLLYLSTFPSKCLCTVPVLLSLFCTCLPVFLLYSTLDSLPVYYTRPPVSLLYMPICLSTCLSIVPVHLLLCLSVYYTCPPVGLHVCLLYLIPSSHCLCNIPINLSLYLSVNFACPPVVLPVYYPPLYLSMST